MASVISSGHFLSLATNSGTVAEEHWTSGNDKMYVFGGVLVPDHGLGTPRGGAKRQHQPQIFRGCDSITYFFALRGRDVLVGTNEDVIIRLYIT